MGSRLSGLLAVCGLGVAMVVGCSSSQSSTCPAGYTCNPNGGSGSSSGLFRKFNDAAGSSGTTPSIVPDGTTGKACKTNAECIGDGGAGINKCSSAYAFKFYGVQVELWASPVCIIPPSATGNCDPAPATDPLGQGVHFCDGPDDPSAPGICLAFNPSAPVAGQGVCYPKCTFGTDGSAATGCVGASACGLVNYLLDTSAAGPDGGGLSLANVQGVGFCQSACQKDADCSPLGTGFVCQNDLGDCTMKTLARTKQPGAACTTAGTTNDETTGACFCAAGSTGAGFCSSVCTVGGNPCPDGWVCETGEPTVLDFGAGAPTFPPLTKQTSGMLGTCTPACTPADAGASEPPEAGASDGSAPSTCPAMSTCQTTTIASPNCAP
jgi:hypothetical protein